MYTGTSNAQLSFKQWIWKNRFYLFAYFIIVLVQFTWFKWLFPYPSFFPDSNSYVEAAYYNQAINMWPIGYSRFLQLFSFISHYDTALVLLQYLLLHVSIIYFLGTVIYFLRPGKWLTGILLLFGVANPILLHMANFVSSDALYTALSIIWVTQLCWIFYRPNNWLLFTHAIVLAAVFTVRYNAIYYPLLSCIVMLISDTSVKKRVLSMAFIGALLAAFVFHTLYVYKVQTGYNQFSAFGGWQMAANALLPYSYVDSVKSSEVPAKFRQLHGYVNEHNTILAARPAQYRNDRILGVYFLWDGASPLKRYLAVHGGTNTKAPNGYFRAWARQAPLFGEYGVYLTKKYPLAYAQYYLWPNLVRYYVPPVEFLDNYNMDMDVVEDMEKKWFRYPTEKIFTRTKDRHISYMFIYPYLLAAVNLLYVLGLIGFLALGGWKTSTRYYKNLLLLVLAIWCCNLGFSVLASPIVLRYQIFPMLLSFTFGILLIAYVIRQAFSPQQMEKQALYQ